MKKLLLTLILGIFLISFVSPVLTIHQYTKPELTIKLASGGTLVADTTYYVSAVFYRNAGWTYDGANGAMADVSSLTTNSTHKTINVNWRVTINVTGFEDAGGGLTRVVTGKNHLITGNTITITNANYSGSHTATWENYENFTIPVAYNGTNETTYYMDTLHDYQNGIILYCDTLDPDRDAPETWRYLASRFSHHYVQYGFSGNNLNITAPYTTSYSRKHHQVVNTDLPSWHGGYEKGKPWIYIDTGAYTYTDLRQAIIDSDTEDIGYCNSNHFSWTGYMYGQSGSLTLEDTDVYIRSGAVGSNSYSYDRIICNDCNIANFEGGYKARVVIGGDRNTFISDGAPTVIFPMGDNNVYHLNSITWEGLPKSYSNLDFYCTSYLSIGYLNKVNYLYENWTVDGCDVNPYYCEEPTEGEISLRKFSIKNAGTYDFQLSSSTITNESIFEDVDTDRGNNEKIVYFNTGWSGNLSFKRTGNMIVEKQDGTLIENADVTITDNTGRVYSYLTNASGRIEFNVVEQQTNHTTTPAYGTNTFYNFTFTITKTDYETYSGLFNLSEVRIDKPFDWTITLESRDWDYSQTLAWKILNLTDTTILKLDENGNLAIAGELYENTNTAPPNVIYKVANVFWLTQKGDLYLVKELMELI